MTTWTASLEWTADLSTAPEDVADTLLAELADHHIGAVAFPNDIGRWGATISIEAGTIRQATDAALALLAAATRTAGQRRVTVVAVDVIDDAGLERRFNSPDIPELVGYAEIGEMAGVSRQRGRKIATDHDDFPPVVAHPAGSGPLFVRAAVVRHLAKPRRAGGRPRKDAGPDPSS